MKSDCEECGMESVNHRIEYFMGRVDWLSRKLFLPFEILTRSIKPFADAGADRFFPIVAEGLFRTGLARKITKPDEHSSESSQALWSEASRRGIDMYEIRLFGLPRRSFVSRHEGKTVAFQGLPRTHRVQKSVFWIDDKAEMKKRFLKAGFPVAAGGSVSSERKALKMFQSLRKPVIVKPREGSAGRHTAVHIETEKELAEVYRIARQVSPNVIVEEELRGPVFRATLVNGRLVAVLRRDPPQVVGDGSSTIRELTDQENKNPLRRGPVFAEINLDSAYSKRELSRQGFSPDSVPPPGKAVFFHFKVNWGVGGTSYDVTDETHPDNVKLFEDIGAYLQEDIVGIDFMIEDISSSWRDVPRCGVIECNSLPLIGNHHFPYKGPVKNVAGAVWDMVFPESSNFRDQISN